METNPLQGQEAPANAEAQQQQAPSLAPVQTVEIPQEELIRLQQQGEQAQMLMKAAQQALREQNKHKYDQFKKARLERAREMDPDQALSYLEQQHDAELQALSGAVQQMTQRQAEQQKAAEMNGLLRAYLMQTSNETGAPEAVTQRVLALLPEVRTEDELQYYAVTAAKVIEEEADQWRRASEYDRMSQQVQMASIRDHRNATGADLAPGTAGSAAPREVEPGSLEDLAMILGDTL